MAVVTVNTEVMVETWTLAASGAGEFHVELGMDGEYALAGSTPAERSRGHSLKGGAKVTIDLPASVNLYVRARVGLSGATTLVVTPGQ